MFLVVSPRFVLLWKQFGYLPSPFTVFFPPGCAFVCKKVHNCIFSSKTRLSFPSASLQNTEKLRVHSFLLNKPDLVTEARNLFTIPYRQSYCKRRCYLSNNVFILLQYSKIPALVYTKQVPLSLWTTNRKRFPERILRNADQLYISPHNYATLKRILLYSVHLSGNIEFWWHRKI